MFFLHERRDSEDEGESKTLSFEFVREEDPDEDDSLSIFSIFTAQNELEARRLKEAEKSPMSPSASSLHESMFSVDTNGESSGLPGANADAAKTEMVSMPTQTDEKV